MVLVGFSVVFYIATVFRRTLLYSMASAAVAIAAGLSALAAGTDQCGWPAFFSISLVFAFPCVYSCCWQFQAHRQRARDPGGHNSRRSARDSGGGAPGNRAGGLGAHDKHGGATVVIVFPNGDVMLGVEEDDGGGDGDKVRKKKEKGEKRAPRGERGMLAPSGSSRSVQGNENTAGDAVPPRGGVPAVLDSGVQEENDS